MGTLIKKTLLPSEQKRADVAQDREAWKIKQKKVIQEKRRQRLFFLDETCLKTNMCRLYGRSLKGERCESFTPHGHWNTTTFVSVLGAEGIEAPMVLEGALDGKSFKAYVEQNLVPILRKGDRIIIDNLSVHKVSGIAEMIEAKGASVIFLPVYSPDFNPIEKAFSKLKALLKGLCIRTKEALWESVGKILSQITAEECKNYIKSCGYVIN